jgi:hypothetical protein
MQRVQIKTKNMLVKEFWTADKHVSINKISFTLMWNLFLTLGEERGLRKRLNIWILESWGCNGRQKYYNQIKRDIQIFWDIAPRELISGYRQGVEHS